MTIKNILTQFTATVVTSATLFAVSVANIPKAYAASFSWMWNSGMYSAQGTFMTDVETGIISEDDVSSHIYKVFEDGEALYEIDLVNEIFTAFDGGSSNLIEVFHDFAYDLDSNQFSIGSDVDDSEFPIDFTVQTLEGDSNDGNLAIFTGLSFGADSQDWFLERDGIELATSDGLDSGPFVEPVPEPASVLGLLAVGAVGAGSMFKRKYN